MKKFLIILLFIFLLSSACKAITEIDLNPEVAWQGKTLFVQIKPDDTFKTIGCTFLNRKIKFYPQGDGFRGIIGIPPDQKPGIYNLHLAAIKEDGSILEVDKEIKVRATKFKKISYYLPPPKKKLLVKELIEEEWAKIEKTLTTENPEQRWSGKFSKPVPDIITMEYGAREYINNKRSGQHRGTDFRAEIGTKVLAPNSGKVVFADKLKAFGGTIVIDHGQGIHTLYFHLSKFLAEVGQMVEKGEVITLSGNSGISSGPHLHFGMSVHNVRVDPMQWVKYLD